MKIIYLPKGFGKTVEAIRLVRQQNLIHGYSLLVVRSKLEAQRVWKEEKELWGDNAMPLPITFEDFFHGGYRNVRGFVMDGAEDFIRYITRGGKVVALTINKDEDQEGALEKAAKNVIDQLRKKIEMLQAGEFPAATVLAAEQREKESYRQRWMEAEARATLNHREAGEARKEAARWQVALKRVEDLCRRVKNEFPCDHPGSPSDIAGEAADKILAQIALAKEAMQPPSLELPSKEEADVELRAAGLDPEKVGREMRERLEAICCFSTADQDILERCKKCFWKQVYLARKDEALNPCEYCKLADAHKALRQGE